MISAAHLFLRTSGTIGNFLRSVPMLKFSALSSADWVLAGLLLSGPVLTTRSSQAALAPPLIPREVLFGNPEIVGITLSPEGKQLA